MLQRLHISNYALIDYVDISFRNGLSSITGETGAGKSIILGALSLLLGKRCDTSVLKDTNQKSIIEAEFFLQSSFLKPLFDANDVDFELQTIIRREISPQGKSRAFINDTPVALSVLKEIGEQLFDIHSQHQNLLLRDSQFQCMVVDAAANNQLLLQEYAIAYNSMQEKRKRWVDFKHEIAKKASELEYLEFRLQELQQAKLQPNELEEIEQEFKIVEHSEDLKTVFEQADTTFSGEMGFLPQLKSLVQAFEKRAHLSGKMQAMHERLTQLFIESSDVSADIAQLNTNLEFDPQQLDKLSQRIDELHSLLHKFKVATVEELIEEKERLEALVNKIQNFDEDVAVLEKEYEAQKKITNEIALELHENRKQAIAVLEPKIISMLQMLGMPSVSFKISIEKLPVLQLHGIDSLNMMFSANKNIHLQWLSEVSSGGELSRLMLCLKAILAQSKMLQTIIFDEIDTGVSGEIAEQMGAIMQSMSQDLQVIVITHLPQIAAKGATQFKVFKQETEETTTTNIIELNLEQRIEEIAKMMSGKLVSDAALDNAKHLLGIN